MSSTEASSLLPFRPRDFLLFRRDSPNLAEISYRTASPWLTDFFLLVSSTERDEALFVPQHSGTHHRDSPQMAAVTPSVAASLSLSSSNLGARGGGGGGGGDSSDSTTRPVTIIVHICPVTGRFLHRNLRGVDVFDSRAAAMTVLEKNFGCVRVQDGQFGALLGACFVRNAVDAPGVNGASIPTTELHLVVCDSPFASPSSPHNLLVQSTQQQGTAAPFNVLLSPPIAPAQPPPAVSNNGTTAMTGSSITPGFRPVSSTRILCVSSSQLGILCDPQVDYSAPATIQASSAGKLQASLPSFADTVSLLNHYSRHLAFQCDIVASPSTAPSQPPLLHPQFYSSSDFAALDQDQLRWNYNESPKRSSGKPTVVPPPPLVVVAPVTDPSLNASLETLPCAVPWNFGIAAALHHRSGCGGGSNLSWLCPKVTPIFEQTVAGFGSGSSSASYSSSAAFSASSQSHHQQHQQSQQLQLESVRVACIPTFLLLRSSRAQAEPMDNATIRWNLFCAGTECAVLTVAENSSSAAQRVNVENKLWVCSCPRSASSSGSKTHHHHHHNHHVGSSSNNPSASPEVATEHLTPVQLIEFYAALQTTVVATMLHRWSKFDNDADAIDAEDEIDHQKKRKRHSKETAEGLFSSHVGDLDFGIDDDEEDAHSGDERRHVERQGTETRRSIQGRLDSDVKALMISTTKSAWLDFVVSSLSSLEQQQQQQPSKLQSESSAASFTKSTSFTATATVASGTATASQKNRSPSPDSALLLRIAEHCYHASRVACLQCTVLGLPRVRPLAATPVVRLRINRAPITALATNRVLVADVLPTGVLRGIWCHNRVLRNSIAMTFAVPRGTRVTAVGFLRPVFCRPPTGGGAGGAGGGSGSSSTESSTRQIPGCPFPVSNRPELKYKAPFPSTAWSVTVSISSTPTDDAATVLLHDVSLPIVMYTEQKKQSSSSSASHHGKNSSIAGPEHALCVLRLPVPDPQQQLASGTGSAAAVLTRGFFDTDDTPSSSQAAAADRSSPGGSCSFVTVVLRGSLNSESAFGTHQIVFFGEEPDVVHSDCISNIVAVPASTRQPGFINSGGVSSASNSQKAKRAEGLSQQQQQQQQQNAVSSEPLTLLDAIVAEEKRHAAAATHSEWQSLCARHGGVRASKLDLNAHVCELPLSVEIGKAIAAAGGNINAAAGHHAGGDAPVVVQQSTTCQIAGCGKGGFFTRLSTCESCGKQVCGSHWRKIKDWRILARCSPVGLFLVCSACESLGTLLDASMKQLILARSTTSAAAAAVTTTPSSKPAAAVVGAPTLRWHQPLAEMEDTVGSGWKRAELCVRDELMSGGSSGGTIFGGAGGDDTEDNETSTCNNNNNNNNTAPGSDGEDDETLLLEHFSSSESGGGGIGGWRAADKVLVASDSRVTVSFCVPRHAHAAAERAVLMRPAALPGARIAAVVSVSVTSGDGCETVPNSFEALMNNNNNNNNHENESALIMDARVPVASIAAAASTSSDQTLTRYDIPIIATSSKARSSSVFAPSSSTTAVPIELSWKPMPRSREIAIFSLARGARRPVPFGAQQLASPICAVDIVTVTLEIVSSLTPQHGGAVQMLRAASRVSIALLARRRSGMSQEVRLATSLPQRRRAVASLFAHEDDDEQPQGSNFAGSPTLQIPQKQQQQQQQQDLFDESSSSTSSLAMRSSSLTSSHTSAVTIAPPIQYSTECTADMSVRNMIMCPLGQRTHCRVWIRPPTQQPASASASASSSSASQQQQAQQQQQQTVSPTHGVWGHAAGVMLRVPFAVSPALSRGAPAVNAATCVRSFRAFVIERSLYCKAQHAATLHVPLVFLVTRSVSLQNTVEIFLPFGQSVKEQQAAGFVLDVAATERGCSSGGWEREWAAMADAASPFFVKEPLATSSQQQQQQQQQQLPHKDPKTGRALSMASSTAPSAAAATLAGYRGSPLATVNMGDAGSLMLLSG